MNQDCTLKYCNFRSYLIAESEPHIATGIGKNEINDFAFANDLHLDDDVGLEKEKWKECVPTYFNVFTFLTFTVMPCYNGTENIDYGLPRSSPNQFFK